MSDDEGYRIDVFDLEDGDEEEDHECDDCNQDRSWDPEARSWKGDIRMNEMPPEALRPAGGVPGKSENTGPKGVKRDYEIAKRNLQNEWLRNNLRTKMAIKRAAFGEQKYEANNEPTIKAKEKKKKSESDDEESEESDDEAFLAYKMQRLKAFQEQLPTYGTFKRVGVHELAEAVKTADPSTYTVIHVYENDNVDCTRLNLVVEELAPQFEHVQFLRIRCSEAMPTFHRAGLPLLLVYKGADQIKSHIRVTAQIGHQFELVDLARWMDKEGLLKLPEMADELLAQGYTP